MNARGVFWEVVSALLQSTPSGDGSIYRPKSLTPGQVLQYSEELTHTYGAQYTALLQSRAGKR